MNITRIDTKQAQAIRNELEAAWQQYRDNLIADARDEDWAKVSIDPARMLDAVPGLSLKANYRLHAYIYQENRDMNGVVWALPAGESLPGPSDCEEEVLPALSWTLEEIDLYAPYPPDALINTMEAIEGDNSPLSYLSTSLLAREFSEFGADYHGIFWGDFALLREDHLRETDWDWIQALPANWQPEVQIVENNVTVTFFTWSSAGQYRVQRHTDSYKLGEYTLNYDEQVIALGGKGFNR